MNLYALIESEKGKVLGKGGQDYLTIRIQNRKQELIATLYVYQKDDVIVVSFAPLAMVEQIDNRWTHRQTKR